MEITGLVVTKKITEFVVKTDNSPSVSHANKRSSSILNPPEYTREVKKLNRENNMEIESEQCECTEQIKGTLDTEGETTVTMDQNNLQQILGPLMNEFKLLREIVDKNYTKLDVVQREISLHQKEVLQELKNLENTISTQRKEIMEEICKTLEYANKNIKAILIENKQLKRKTKT